MSRIADANARAGRALSIEDGVRSWEIGRDAADALLKEDTPPAASRAEPAPIVAPPPPLVPRAPDAAPPAVPAAASDSFEYELVVAIRRIFLYSRRSVRSVLFCAPPGDGVTTVAWQAAEVLAAHSGRRIAFIEEGADDPRSATPGLITRVGRPAAVVDLYASFDFVIVSATAQAAEDLVQAACDVDGVVVVVTEDVTRRHAAVDLVRSLRRRRQVNLLGVILAQADRGPSLNG